MGNAIPHPGDVVVHRHVRSRAVYALSRLNAPLQSCYKTYEEALARAVGFARRERVDAWYTADECIYERLAGHRPSADGSPGALNSTCRLRRPDALVTSTPPRA